MKSGISKTKPAVKASPVEPTHEEIAARAYELFLARGKEHGHDLEDWARAEAEIRRKRQVRSARAQQQWSGGYR